jgi:iron complex transport system substrate-binding protein
MITKNKIVAFLEIAIVLCSVFLVAIPAIAAEQTTQKASASEVTTASEDDYVLGIYGNANEDDTIDMGDVVYTKLAIFGKKPKTELCDAKYDGRINVLDVIQTKLIILGKEKELTIVQHIGDSPPFTERVVTVKKPLKRIVVTHRFTAETLRSIKVPKDIIVGVSGSICKDNILFPEFSDVPSVGHLWSPDLEVILNLNPDVAFLMAHPGMRSGSVDRAQEVLESADITVLRFYSNCWVGRHLYPEEIRILGYIFNKENEAEEFRDWYEGVTNPIIEKAINIPDDNKPTVYFESRKPYTIYSTHIEEAGGKDIFIGLIGSAVDPEAVVARNPDIIVKIALGGDITGYHLDAEDTTEIEKVREEIMSRPELQKVKAVKTGRVYVSSIYFAAAMPSSSARNFLQLAYNAKWFHPELFEDLDPKAIHQEYLTKFQGLEIDLDKKGVFVYPEPT